MSVSTRQHRGPRARALGGIGLRLAAWLAALALVALPVVGLVRGWFASERWPFRELEVEAAFERVNVEQVRAAAAPLLEVGFFAVDLDAIRGAVEGLPWVAAAEVRKRWPDRIEIRLREREAVALWGDRRLLSVEGELFAVPGDTVPQGLPELAGPDARAGEVLAFMHAADAALAGSGLRVASLTLSGRGSYALTLSNGAEVVLGRVDVLMRLQRFLAAWTAAPAPEGAHPLRVDLRYSNGFAIEWSAPIPAPRSADPTSTPQA
jgi:cell division protein FtsQ